MDKKKVTMPLVCHAHYRPVVDLFYSLEPPDGFFLISASKGDALFFFSSLYWSTGDWIGTFEGHKDTNALRAASASADLTHCFEHKYIVSMCFFQSGVEKILCIFDLNHPDAPPREVDNSPGSIRTIAWLHSAQTILSSCTDIGGVRLWDVRSGKSVQALDTKSSVTSAEVSQDGRYIITADGSTVKFWDANHYNLSFNVESASMEPKFGNKFVAGGEDMWIHIFDFHTREEIGMIRRRTIRIWQTAGPANNNENDSVSADDVAHKIEGFHMSKAAWKD
ncbi:hypothetical protein K2173_005790 [Erythroxylum novogranatense]|uniref:Serine-threonine kinase receptor-associated protein n=1 Tax=Erythroxylum novogranatense TaxID=1862640 RepID=A0AAV8U5T7_9ROSI|nr:hypothetical protein K2173_005790 [Erythroxylum novogranatense]